MKSLFELCIPREDVLKGTLRESDFAADLAQVLNKVAPEEYLNPKIFFANTFPTQGLRDLLSNSNFGVIRGHWWSLGCPHGVGAMGSCGPWLAQITPSPPI